MVLSGPDGREQTLAADERGVAATADLAPGTYEVRATMEAFRPTVQTVTVRRGANQVTITLPLAIQEEVTVSEVDAAGRRDNGFTTTLTPEEIEGLSDDPDEMAEQLAQMAGPGAQIFVDGFRGGRLPPKDQIQQVRYRTNSYAAEYHDAGMVRVEVITRPGMGNWRSRANFGFRDESMNGTNAFAGERAPEQVKRWQVNSQGPIVKGKTSVSFSVEGNDSYDSQTIVATVPAGEVRGQIRRPNEVLNATIRVEQALGAGNALRAEYQRRTQDRRNLGVGDFDLPERAYRTDGVTDTLRLRNTRVISKSMFSELKFEFVQTENQNASFSDDPTVRVLDTFTGGGAGQSGTRHGPPVRRRRQPRLHRAQARPAHRPAVRGGAVGQHPADQRQRHLHVLCPRGLRGWPGAAVHAGGSATRWSTTRSTRPAGTSRTTSGSARTCR